ncbi:MAG: hypothetical protein KKC20_24790 [Proteobacteria bacterium]|nr:hypothetical protein [Pseudomonadota bacterium]
MQIFDVLGLIVFPLGLIGWIVYGFVQSIIINKRTKVISSDLNEAIKFIEIDNPGLAAIAIENVENILSGAGFEANNYALASHLSWSSSEALSSEKHIMNESDIPLYYDSVSTAIDQVDSAIKNRNIADFAMSVGRIYLLDAHYRVPIRKEKEDVKPPSWIIINTKQPLYLVKMVLDKVIMFLEEDDLYAAQGIVKHAVRSFCKANVDDDLAPIPFLALKWTQRYLDSIEDVRDSKPFWMRPEDAVLKTLKKAREACASNSYQNLVTVISTSTDAYRTPRF